MPIPVLPCPMHRHRKTSKRRNAQPQSGGKEGERGESWVDHSQRQRKERDSNHFIFMCFKESFNLDIATNNLYISSLCELCQFSVQILNVANENIPLHSAPRVTEVSFLHLEIQKSRTCQQALMNICITMTQKVCNIHTLINRNEIHFTRLTSL